MRRALVIASLSAACFVVAPVSSPAQEMIHALTGTVSAIDTSAKTITVMQDSGSEGEFHALTNPKTRINFDKKVEATTTAATSFDKQGAYAIIFYFGTDSNRTAVALKSLGKGPFTAITGTVTEYDGHSHSITVKDDKGATQTFRIDPQTVAETYMGVVEGSKFDAHKGDNVRIVGSTADGATTALFVRDI